MRRDTESVIGEVRAPRRRSLARSADVESNVPATRSELPVDHRLCDSASSLRFRGWELLCATSTPTVCDQARKFDIEKPLAGKT